MNIDYKLLEEQRDHLLSILWHDFKPSQEKEDQPVPLDRKLGWGIVHLMDSLLDADYYKKNPNHFIRATIINFTNVKEEK